MACIHCCRLLADLETEGGAFPMGDALLTAFFAGSAAFVKNEGGVFGMILMAVGGSIAMLRLCSRQRLNELPKLVLCLFIFLVVLFAWPSLLALRHVNILDMQDAFVYSDLLHIGEYLDRWPVMRSYFWKHLLSMAPVLVACGLISLVCAFVNSKLRSVLMFLWGLLIAHSTFVTLPYFVTRLNFNWHIANSFERLMSQHFFIYATILVLCGVSLLAAVRPKSGEAV